MTNAKRGAERPLTAGQRALVEDYMPLAMKLARRARLAWPPAREDMISTAYLALIEAATRFDPARDVPFATFARHRIVGALRDAAREVVTRSGRRRRASPLRHVRLADESRPGAPGVAVLVHPDPPVGARLEAVEQVERWLRRLPPLHARTCRAIYIRGLSQKEAAEALKCSQARISAVHRQALTLLTSIRPAPRGPRPPSRSDRRLADRFDPSLEFRPKNVSKSARQNPQPSEHHSKAKELPMLVLKRKEGQWIEVTHKSGDVLRFRIYNIACDYPGRANLAFEDDARNFEIQRPERFAHRREQEAAAAEAN